MRMKKRLWIMIIIMFTVLIYYEVNFINFSNVRNTNVAYQNRSLRNVASEPYKASHQNRSLRNPVPEPNKTSLVKSITYFPKDFCPHIYGTIAIVTLTTSGTYINEEVFNAMQSIRCYAKMRGYDLFQMRLEKSEIIGLNDRDIQQNCQQYSILWMRHCIIANLLHKYDYIVHLDADSGVINPNHCFEEYITPRIDIFHLERVHSGEIQAGHYIVKNSNFSREYLRQWYEYSKDFGSDNAVIHRIFSAHVLNETAHIKCSDVIAKREPYFVWIRCIKENMAGKRVFEHIKVYQRAHSFVRDGWITNFKWSNFDFLLHAMKRQDDVLFTRKLSPRDCNNTGWDIPVKTEYFIKDIDMMRNVWRKADQRSIEFKFAVQKAEISNCWPYCPDNI